MSESVSSHTKIKAAVDEIMDVLVDVEAYPKWAKAVKSVQVRSVDDKGRPEQVVFEVTPGPLPHVRYVLHYVYAQDRVSWTLVEGDLNDLQGSYTLTPSDGGTDVVYDLTIDMNLPLPGFVKARAARELTKVALDELRQRVEQAR